MIEPLDPSSVSRPDEPIPRIPRSRRVLTSDNDASPPACRINARLWPARARGWMVYRDSVARLTRVSVPPKKRILRWLFPGGLARVALLEDGR